MKRKCDRCERPATFHSVEIVKGQKIEKHLCEHHATQDGLTKAVHTPIDALLTNFVKMQSGVATVAAPEVCDQCGLKFTEFREHSLLGCPACYIAFEPALAPLLERAQEGATHHVGKAPRRAGTGEQRQQVLTRMRKRLAEAVEAEDYELAARLRDDLRRFEEQPQ